MEATNNLQTAMRDHFDNWQLSGLSQIGYCSLHGLSFAKFNYWVRKFRGKRDAAPVPQSGFLSVSVSSLGTPILEVTRKDGQVLRFYRGADAGFVKSLLD
ncbi:hypothetical protein SAMN05216436_12856 [bacterium A37T11]|nr:hypothetical protein SAMN05216436_12856 [bacterium A37T11]